VIFWTAVGGALGRTGRKLFAGPIEYLMRGAQYFLSRAFYARAATYLSLRRYCSEQLEKRIPKFLYIPGRSGRSMETDRIYVPATLRNNGEPTLRQTKDLPVGYYPRRLGVSRGIVIGDPGSGKTTYVKHSFRLACARNASLRQQNKIQMPVEDYGAPRSLPIFIELKIFSPPVDVSDSDLAGWAVDNLRKTVISTSGYDLDRLFDTFITGRGLEIYLDGLDEVATDAYQRTARMINALSVYLEGQSRKNRLFLTMRAQFYQQVGSDFIDTFPSVYSLDPFTPDDIYKFLLRWPFASRRRENASRIFNELSDRPTLRDMCSNPLVLSMYVAADQDDPESPTPDTRTAFYSQVTEELLVTRRSRQLRTAARTTIREQRERVLGRLAWENLSDPDNPANSVPWVRAIDLVQEVYGGVGKDSDVRLNDMIRDTGILQVEREGETLRFIHLTFCEFLAAKHAVVSPELGWPAVLEAHSAFRSQDRPEFSTRLLEVVPFTAGLVPRSARFSLLEQLSQSSGDNELLGRSLLETQAYDSPTWKHYVDNEVDFLTRAAREFGPQETDAAQLKTHESNVDSRWLSRINLLSVTLRDAEDWSAIFGTAPQYHTEEIMRSLSSQSPSQVKAVIAAFASQDGRSAYRLAKSLGFDLAVDIPMLVAESCKDRAFFDLVVSEAVQQSPSNLHWPRLIVEAGLTSLLANRNLAAIDAPAAWSDEAVRVKKDRQWAGLGKSGYTYFHGDLDTFEKAAPLRGTYSLYTAALTLSFGGPRPDESQYERANWIWRVRGPGRYVGSPLARLIAWVLTAFAGSIIVYMLVNGVSVWILSAVVALQLALICARYSMVKKRIYMGVARTGHLERQGVSLALGTTAAKWILAKRYPEFGPLLLRRGMHRKQRRKR
jgi:hypothetical protein